MPNDVKLQEGHPVDENLRPIKVGGKATAIETAQHGDGVKINGNLTVTGSVPADDTKLSLAGGTMTGDIAVPDGFTIDCGGDMSIDCADGDLAFQTGGVLTCVLDMGASPNFVMAASPGDTDFFQLSCTTNGITTLATTDSDGEGAHFLIDCDGDLILDPHTGGFIARKAGTEFSVAKSAYAGMILGYTTVGIDAADDSHTLVAATMTVVDDAMKVKFVAPPSGIVEIFVSIYGDFARRSPVFGLSDADTTGYSAIDFPNANDVTNEHILRVPPSSGGDSMLRNYWVVTGLTAGTAYEWWLAAKTSIGVGGVLRWGGNATNKYPPFIMKATALPAATADFAVYG